MEKPSRQKIINSIYTGIIEAQEEFYKGSRGLICWVHEYMITVNIYHSLLKLPAIDDTLGLEEKASDIEDYKRVRRGRKPACVCGRSRCDVVLWHAKKDGPRAVIEVKRWAEDCGSDIKRLEYFVSKVPSVEFCITASCLFEKVKSNSGNNENKLQNRIKQLHVNIQNRLVQSSVDVSLESTLSNIFHVKIPVYYGKTMKEDEWVWCPVIFKIYRKNIPTVS
jgi:hypothetical protein